jgi:predicted enzyme related to lactoylglutathione lyase
LAGLLGALLTEWCQQPLGMLAPDVAGPTATHNRTTLLEEYNMTRVINWFEIPAANFERAVAFYENTLGIALKRDQMNGRRLALFPYEGTATGGCVCEAPAADAGPGGPLIYLEAGADVGTVLSRIEANGGRVVTGATRVSDDIGDIGVFIDTEGNRVGVHRAP